jgi:outer membrane receptor for ferrienterochelin and colicins
LRYQYYNDNTPATVNEDVIDSSLFAQDEIAFNDKHKILLGARYDYNDNHGSIFTPRFLQMENKRQYVSIMGTGFNCKFIY